MANNGRGWMQPKRIISIVVAMIVVLAVFAAFSWRNSVMNEGLAQQNTIIKLQRDVEIEISECLDKGSVAARVTEKEYATLKDLLVNVTAARYEGGSGALSQGGSLVSALQENYPQIDQSTWKILTGIVVGCREDVSDRQERLQGYVASFKTWAVTGGLIEKMFRSYFPSDDLTTTDRKTGALLKGNDALEYLARVITVVEAREAMKSGTIPNQDLFPPATNPAPPTR